MAEENMLFDEAATEVSTHPIEVWDETPAPTPEAKMQVSDPVGSAALVSSAVGGTDLQKLKQAFTIGEVDPLLKEASQIVLKNTQDSNNMAFNDAITTGNADLAVQIYNKIQEGFQAARDEANSVDAYRQVTEKALENASVLDPRTKIPEGTTISQLTDQHMADVAASSGKGFVANAGKWAEFLGKGILLETIYRNSVVGSAVSAFFLPQSTTTYYWSTNTMYDDIRASLDGMSAEDQHDALSRYVKYAKDNGVDDITLMGTLASITDQGQIEHMLMAVGDVAGPVGDLLTGVGVITKLAKGTKAKGGMKVLGDASGGTNVGKVVGEEVGKGTLSAEEVLDYATKLSPRNVLPEGVFGTSSAVQQRIIDDTSKLIADLQNRLQSQTVYAPELDNMVKSLRLEFDPNVNKAIRSYDVTEASESGIRGTVTWGNKDGVAFATKDAANEFAKRKGMKNYEVIKDTSSSGFAVKQDVIDAYKAELSSLSKELGEAPKAKAISVYHGSVSSDPIIALREEYISSGEGKLTEGYGHYFTNDRNLAAQHASLGEVGSIYRTDVDPVKMYSWNGYVSEASKKTQNNILKAIKELAPDEYSYYKTNGLELTGKELYRDVLGGNYDAKRASDVLAKYGVEGHFYDNVGDSFNYDALARGVEGRHLNYVVYPNGRDLPVKPSSSVTMPQSAGSSPWTQEAWDKAVADVVNKKHTYDNLWMGKSAGVLKNMTPAIKVSGDIGKKASEAVVAWHKMLGFGGRKLVVITAAEARKLATKFKDMEMATLALGKGDAGVHFSYDNVHYIVMNIPVNTNSGIHTLAHEMGHMFDETFKRQHSKAIDNAYTQWMKDHLPKGGWDDIATKEQMEKAMSFRNPTERHATDMWNELDPGMQAWNSAKHEWFAEQFSTWLLHHPIPRSQFEHLLQNLMDKLTTFAKDVAERIGIPTNSSSKYVERFLNDHIINVQKGRAKDTKVATDLADKTARKDELEKLIREAEDANMLPTHGYLVREHRVDDVRYSAIDGFTSEDIHSSFWIGIDPKHLVSEFLVEGRVVGIHQEAKMMKSLSQFMIDAISSLNKKSLQKVYNVLKKGDTYSDSGDLGKEFNAVELTGMGLGEKEQEAYFKLRTARNVMFELKDDEYAKAMRKQGFKQLGLDFGDGKTFVSAGRTIEAPTMHSTVYDVDLKKRTIVDQKYLDDIKAGNRKVVKIEERHTPEGETSAFTTFVVNNDNLTVTDVRNVLRKRPGEFSRIYTDEYFITLEKTVETDGTSGRLTDTIHTATTKADAEAFVKGMNQLAKADPATLTIEKVEDAVGQWVKADDVLREFKEGKYTGAVFAQHYNRIKDDYVTNFTRGLEGSMFTGRRGQRLTSISEDKENTLDIFGSLQAELVNTARVVGRTDWRNAAIQRWYNEALKAGALPDSMRALSPTQAFEWAGQASFRYVGSGKQGKFLERTHKYIRMQLGMKTPDEEMFEAATRIFSERYLDKSFGGKLEPVGKLLRSSNPTSFLRTVNFHSMLGFMNPSQLLVQTMGSVAAIALHPIHGVASGKAAPLLRMALMSDNPEVWKTMARINNFAELGFGSTEDFINTIKAIRKSGVLDGIHSTSLHNIEEGTYNVFGTFRRKAGQASLWTFNRGEEMARIISFDVARKEWQAANAGKDFLSDDAIRSIVIRMDDFTQNMTKANEAFFQRGILSIPSQFLQYQVKLYANIISAFATAKGAGHRGFTRGEAAKILAGHVVLFGIANNGLGSLVEESFGKMASDAGMSEDQRFAMSQGLTAALLDKVSQATTGEELKTSIGSRLAAFDWWSKYAEALTSNSFLEVAAGPSYSWVRSGEKTANVLSMWVKNPDITFAEVMDGLKQVGESQISTWRNATKAYVASMHSNTLQSATGDDVATLSNSELLFQALGIAPIEVYEKGKIDKLMSGRYDTLRQLVNTIATQQQRAMTARLDGDDELAKALSLSAASLIPDNAGDREFVLRNLRKMQKENKGYNESVTKYLMKDMDVPEPFLTQDLGGSE